MPFDTESSFSGTLKTPTSLKIFKTFPLEEAVMPETMFILYHKMKGIETFGTMLTGTSTPSCWTNCTLSKGCLKSDIKSLSPPPPPPPLILGIRGCVAQQCLFFVSELQNWVSFLALDLRTEYMIFAWTDSVNESQISFFHLSLKLIKLIDLMSV